MRIGDSFGEACRNCGSTLIIVAPPSSSGRCAVCSHEAVAWAARLEHTSRRNQEMARLAALAAAAEARSAARAQLWAERRAAVTRAGAQARAAATSFVREMQFRVGRPSQA